MFKKTLIAAAISCATFTGLAQAEYNKSVEAKMFRSADSVYQLRASDIIGREILNAKNDEIGEVDDLVMFGEERELQAVVSVGGILGLGEKLVLIPYEDLRIGPDDDYLYYNSTEEALEGLPEFAYIDGEEMGRDVSKRRDEARRSGEENMINWDVVEGNWMQFKGKAQQQWGELTNDDWDIIEGNRKEMVGILQERTGRSRAEVEREINDLSTTL